MLGNGEEGESAEEMVEEGLVMDCCIGEGKLLFVVAIELELLDSGGLEAEDDNWQLFVFVEAAKLLGGFEGIGST